MKGVSVGVVLVVVGGGGGGRLLVVLWHCYDAAAVVELRILFGHD